MASRRKPVTDLSRALWQFLLYPDSATSGDYPDMASVWRHLDEMQVPMCISPIHDADVYEEDDLERGVKAGNLKKPHYHGMMMFDGPVPYSQALDWVSDLGVKKLKLVPSRRSFERYTCHLDSPSKVKYDVADIRTFGGYMCKFLGEQYEMDSIQTIHELIENMGIVYYADLSLQISRNYPELLTTLLRNPAHFNNFCHSRAELLKHSRITGLMSSYSASRQKIGD